MNTVPDTQLNSILQFRRVRVQVFSNLVEICWPLPERFQLIKKKLVLCTQPLGSFCHGYLATQYPHTGLRRRRTTVASSSSTRNSCSFSSGIHPASSPELLHDPPNCKGLRKPSATHGVLFPQQDRADQELFINQRLRTDVTPLRTFFCRRLVVTKSACR